MLIESCIVQDPEAAGDHPGEVLRRHPALPPLHPRHAPHQCRQGDWHQQIQYVALSDNGHVFILLDIYTHGDLTSQKVGDLA